MQVKFEQNRIVRTAQNFELFDKKGFKKTKQNKTKHFWQTVDAILEDLSVAETIV